MLYLIKSGEYMKIGYTNNLRNRLTLYNTDNPNYELVCICDGTLQNEKEWHYKYTLEKGEWGLWNSSVADSFIKEAYLDDLYFQEDLLLVAADDPGKNFVYSLFERGTEEEKASLLDLCKLKKPFPSVSVKENMLVWEPTIHNSLNLYINNILKTLPYIPKRASEKIPKQRVQNNNSKGLEWIKQVLEDREYTYQELEALFEPLFTEHCMKWNKNTSLKLYFPDYISKRKTKNGKKDTYYRFNNF